MPCTSVSVLRDRASLADVAAEWEHLARHAAEPNPFYEHWMVLPGLEGALPPEGIRFVLVWLEGAVVQGRRKLGALFPFYGPSRYKGLPVVALKSYRHAHSRLCTPLVRAGFEHACIAALLDWFRNDGEGAALFEFRHLPCAGRIWHALADVAEDHDQMVLGLDRVARPVLRKRETDQAASEPLPEVDDARWIADFVRLAGRSVAHRYTMRTMHEAFRRGRLLMAGADAGGELIARSAAFTAGEGAFLFKTVFDERFASAAPGLIAERALARQFRRRPELHWIDSLGKESRTFQTLLVGEAAWSELAVSRLPLLRWAKRRVASTLYA